MRVAHRRYQCGRDQRSDAFDLDQTMAAFVLAKDARHTQVVLPKAFV
jgi:hypothetical protein